MIREMLGYQPTGSEQQDILDTTGDRIIISGGEQGGKSDTAAEFGVERILEMPPKSIVWLVGKKYDATEKEYEYMLAKLQILEMVKFASDTTADKPRRIILIDDTIIKTISANDVTNITKEAPRLIIGCEASRLDLEAYYKLVARAEHGHGILLLAGTFERAEPWYGEIYRAYSSGRDGRRAYMLPTWTNRFIYPQGRYDPGILRLEEEMPEDLFLERVAGVVRPPAGLVFGADFDVHLHTSDTLEYDPNYPVSIAVDPGYRAAHSCLFIQVIDETICVFAELYDHRITTEEMCEMALGTRWWKGVNHGVIDVQATKMQQAVKPPVEIWMEKTGLYLASQHVPIMDGIDRFKTFLRPKPITGAPRLLISTKCRGLLSELAVQPSPITGRIEAYRWKTDSSGAIVGVVPRDRNNHSVKALTYWMVDIFGFVENRRRKRARTRFS